jgi:predicted membrane channel-forming protein YqfA (hemolysin III family)
MPAQLLASYDVSLAPMGLVIYQFWGVALMGLGMLTWFARSVRESVLQRKFALALFITNGLSGVMAVRGQFAGANTFGWSTVALFFLLALGFGVFMRIKTREA